MLLTKESAARQTDTTRISNRAVNLPERGGALLACTPDSEAQAQLASGGIPDPILSSLDHKSEVKLGAGEVFLSFHDLNCTRMET
jgi:hypothetical protein